MADNTHQSNNGQSPFRRYVPPESNGSFHHRVEPLAPPPASASGRPMPSTPRVLPKRRRNNRGRWRQWVQSAPMPPNLNESKRTPPRSPQSPQSPPLGQAYAPQPLQPPGGYSVPQPGAPRNEPSGFVKGPTMPNLRNPQAPASPNHSGHAGAGTAMPQRPSYPQRPQRPANNKVTPLRRKPVWSTPMDTQGNTLGPRRDRKPRRRKTPRPVLYGIRLLILGTGVAAIAGTVLSSLNPNQDVAVSEAANSGLTPSGSPINKLGDAPTLTQPLPLGEELVSLETDLVGLEAMTPGLKQAVFFYDLETGNYIDLEGTQAVAAASTIKVPILIAFLAAVDAGTVQLDQAVTLREDLIGGGSGEMQVDAAGTRYTALDVATEMIVNSDNTATNLMISLLGGTEALNQQFRAWGLESTLLRNLLPDLDGTNTTSAADLVRVMALVEQGELLSMRSRDRLFSIMQRTRSRDLIPEGLGDSDALAYNKTGDIGTSLGDIALVDAINGKRYLLAVLVNRPFNDGRASELIRRVSGRIYEEMSQPVNPIGGTAPTEAVPTESEQTPEASTNPADAPSERTAPMGDENAVPEVYTPMPDGFIPAGSEPLSPPEEIPRG